MVTQKEIFLEGEGDAWIDRNRSALAGRKLPEDDPLLARLLPILDLFESPPSLLEIGCSDATRLSWLQQSKRAKCTGLDPSAKAIAEATAKGVSAQQGTADALPFESGSFDVVLFGFCLYLCDRDDLFSIAREADRVLKPGGWIGILDFFSSQPVANPYRHRDGIYSYKMDYRSLFTWNPRYACVTHVLLDHNGTPAGDDPDNWIAVSFLQKADR